MADEKQHPDRYWVNTEIWNDPDFQSLGTAEMLGVMMTRRSAKFPALSRFFETDDSRIRFDPECPPHGDYVHADAAGPGSDPVS